jgi:hypothetical protein
MIQAINGATTLAEQLEAVLEALHDSEINGEVFWFFDAGWTATLGDPLHGIEAEESFDRIGDAVGWLVDKAGQALPGQRVRKAVRAA